MMSERSHEMMLRQLILKFALILMVSLALAGPVLAGGWSVTTLDQFPGNVRVDEPVTIGFVIRQHGIRPMEGLAPVVRATSGDHHWQVEAREDRPGHYSATLAFPEAGTWQWEIDAFGFPAEMPPLEVTLHLTPIEQFVAEFLAWLEPALASVDIEMVDVPSRHLASTARMGGRASADVGMAGLEPDAEYGQALFIAKGCKTCHEHGAIAGVESLNSFSTGPNLTHYNPNPTFLRGWLRNPVAVRPNTQMPTLGLTDAEIEALIAFLSAN
jgi:cytochrome c2